MTSEVKDEKPGYILEGIAETLGVELRVHLNQCILDVPESYGKGQLRLFHFSHGISVFTANFELTKPFDLIYNEGKVHPLKILLIKSGTIEHAFDKGLKKNRFNSFEGVIIGSTPDNNHTFRIPKNKKLTFLSIQINRKKFESKIEDFIPQMHQDLSRLFRDVNGISPFFYKNYYTPETLKIIDDFLSNDDKDFIESVYLEGQTYQLIVLQLKHYLVNQKTIDPNNSIASRTRLKLKQAVDIIESDIENFTTVKALADKLNINEKTLQSVFKQFFNCTVNTYVRNFRAYRTKMLLETTDLSISEIAYKLGFNAPNHLSKLFKLYYGCSPKTYRNQTKTVKET